MSRPEYLTKMIAKVKDPGVREVIRVCDQYITDQSTEKICRYINDQQEYIDSLEKMLRARGVMV